MKKTSNRQPKNTSSLIKASALAALILMLGVHATRAAGADDHTPPTPPVDVSKAMVDSTLQRNPDPKQFGGWGYAKSLYLFGQYEVYLRTHDKKYLDYIQAWVDSHIDENGNLDRKIDALDYVLPANLLLVLYKETHEERYKVAAEKFRHTFDTYPRTSDGGFWHATVPSRQWQLWLDGIYMSQPFLVRYGQMFGDEKYTEDEAVKQLLIYHKHLQDPGKGLLYHAYDESGKQPWADPVTHHSSFFWCRAIGWYGMSIVDLLDVLPKDYPGRKDLIKILNRLASDLQKYQDPTTGLWYQVVDQPHTEGNWQETSSSSMFTYILDVSVKRGYISRKYKRVAEKGYKGVLSKVSTDADGLTNISDICEGTNVGDLNYYFNRKRNTNDFHGLGAFLLMNEEWNTSLTSMQVTTKH
jgi:unsaturated rhamnogalacturonyl hydrolase